MLVIDTKALASDLHASIKDTEHYGDALHKAGQSALSVAVAGAEREVCAVRVRRRVAGAWKELTLHSKAIDWIPSPDQTATILSIRGRTEVAAECPSQEVLANQATRLNEIFRECRIKDEYRPIYAATFMLALWFGDVATDSRTVLDAINANAGKALKSAQKGDLSQSLRVDTENEDLARRAWQIIDILNKLNIRSFIHEHDYLGQLYETFFRYTGGNTIGQYFTPRHIVDMMCELVDVRPNDIVFDPACGTGGFLVGALRRMIRLKHLDYESAIQQVHENIYGIESEPSTAALCITNMLLRGDGRSGIVRDDCFANADFPNRNVDVAILNPPFPHKKTDTKTTSFIDRALTSVRHKGLVASVIPYSLLVNCKDWHKNLLRDSRLLFVGTMPADLFSPYASFNTAIVMIQKGVPQDESKVFFARLSNDGFKLKKNNRISQSGSQIPEILQAYSDKASIPKTTAFEPVSLESSEWSPEAYIENSPPTHDEFISGLEKHLRMQAAFYVAHGYRLLDERTSQGLSPAPRMFKSSALSLAGVKFGPINVRDHFNVQLGGKDEIEDLDEDGNTPVVSTSEFNNGVTAWRSTTTMFPAGSITVATDGSTCSSFVQEFDFYAFYKVAIISPIKLDVPIDALYYMAFLLKQERWRYVYARKFGKRRILKTILHCPVTEDGSPNFQVMSELTQQSAAYPVIQSFRKAYKTMKTRPQR